MGTASQGNCNSSPHVNIMGDESNDTVHCMHGERLLTIISCSERPGLRLPIRHPETSYIYRQTIVWHSGHPVGFYDDWLGNRVASRPVLALFQCLL